MSQPAELNKFTVFGYWRSSASWRVRWALELKGLAYETVPVNLLKGEHRADSNLARNPSGFVPTLQLGEGVWLTQSMAILMYLEDLGGGVSLFPKDPLQKAHVIALCEIINADTAPLQKPLVNKKHSDSEAGRLAWAQHWIREGFKSYEAASASGRGLYSVGDQLTAADLFLVPQIYNALRYQIDMASEFPALMAIYEHCLALESCQKTVPERQIDAPSP